MEDPVNWWFEITQYSYTKAMKIANLVKTMWLVRNLWPVEVTYDQGGEFIGQEFKNDLIEREYGTKTNPNSSRIHR